MGTSPFTVPVPELCVTAAEGLTTCLPAYKNGMTFKTSGGHRPMAPVCESMWKLSPLGLGIYRLRVYKEVDEV